MNLNMTTTLERIDSAISHISTTKGHVSPTNPKSPSSSKSRLATSRSPLMSSKSPSMKLTPVSYSRIKYFPYNPDGPNLFSPKSQKSQKATTSIPERELYVNLNCSIRILMEYVRNEANIPESMNFDLFDEMGNLKRTFQVQANSSASSILIQNAVYFIVVIPKHQASTSSKPIILINRGARVNGDYINRIRRQLQTKRNIKSSM